MRLHNIALVIAPALLAGTDSATSTSEQTRLGAVISAETELSTRSLTAGADKRQLRDHTPELAAVDEERDLFEMAKFYYWRKKGYRPGDIYKRFFDGVDRKTVENNPNYEVWQRYNTYYEEETKAE
ncbi:hypothetical protein PHYSODRAFT_284486 [Phytophthora sojae]|uniref:RxLR effector protein n=2 Tax=Phytophthora sojae TaxID=67593 RepID=G4YE31_PHYSP|nr:hypothetical protein PHYSODRAFT_284486 [Phytophthora sojae]AEK81202.1 Avh340 [Phytophthora sojae]AEK81203.1 Avh340 [Phytophthora sojae]AEK81204.1 Avh340 [Phytophthora sojae]EGZ29612.1 hypothetical protein PHYSODRAFT_284486 [Phytophthora sojae]|eukprot:XP_009516887.1 hypothetical protein PHYSODRAFT_284486 [Phytophthora sojae]